MLIFFSFVFKVLTGRVTVSRVEQEVINRPERLTE